MKIIVRIDDDCPFIVDSDSDLERVVFYSDWKTLELIDVLELSDSKRSGDD